MNTDKKIIIIGGGIGGLVVATALHQQGYKPLLFERTTEIKPIGAGIILSMNAMPELNKLNLAQPILQQGWAVENFNLQNQHGKYLSRIKWADVRHAYAFPSVAINRSVLHETILASLPNNCVHLNHEFSAIKTTNTGRQIIQFTNGSSIEADIVIGADGIKSQLRTAVLGKYSLRNSGQVCYRGLASYSDNMPHCFESWGRGQRFGAVPTNQKQVYWYAVIDSNKDNFNTLDNVNTWPIKNLALGIILLHS